MYVCLPNIFINYVTDRLIHCISHYSQPDPQHTHQVIPHLALHNIIII